MPPSLALLLCTAGVLFLLRLERLASPRVSAALWIPTLWMLSVGSKPLAFWFGVKGGANESGSELDRVMLAGFMVAGMAVLACRRFDCSGALRRHGWLLLLFAYMLASTLWSEMTLIAIRRWVRDVIVIIMALVISSEVNPVRSLESVLRRFAYVLIPFSLVLIKYYPALGVSYGRWSGELSWVGVAFQKNGLGRLCMVSAMFLLWALYRRWRRCAEAGTRHQGWADVAVLLIALYLLKGPKNAYSATSVGSLAMAIVIFLGLLWFRQRQFQVSRTGLLVVVTFLIGFGASAPFLGGSNVAAFSSSLGRDDTLTGRTGVWEELLPVVERQPLLGHGFGSFWTTARREFYRISHAHNGYLDIMLELGVVGLVLYAIWLLSCARTLHTALAEDYYWGCLAICFLLTAVVSNTTESALNTMGEPTTAVLALACLVLPHRSIRASQPRCLGLQFAGQTESPGGMAVAQPGAVKVPWSM